MPRSQYHRVRGLEKGLAVLHALSRLGESSAAALAAATGLPRPTAHRMAETLLATGYVARGRIRGTYRLTSLVRSLAEGYRGDDWISDAAEPVLRELSEQIVWPCDIATYDEGAMVIRSSTHHSSPLSLHRSITGRRFPMLSTSIGLAYLAFCPARECDAILELIARGNGTDATQLQNGFNVQRALAETRKRGYGVRKRDGRSRTASIAVPVKHRRRVLGCLNVVWIDSAIAMSAAVKEFQPVLRKAVRQIEAQIRHSGMFTS